MFRASGWVYLGKIADRGVRFLRMLILARLLMPEDFGLFGIVLLTKAAFMQLTSMGIDRALIQRPGSISRYLDTGWTIELVRHTLLALLLAAAAPAVATFFREPRATPLLQAMSISFVLIGLSNIGIVFFDKELEIRKRVFLEITSSIVAMVLGIILAYALRSAWALVFAELAWALTRCVLSYVLHPYRPRWNLDPAQARTLLNFGKWVLGSTITIYIGMYFDNLTVGRVLGATALGIYAMAYNISCLALDELTYTISRIAFPGFAKLQETPEKMKSGFDRVFQLSTALSIPAAVGTAVVAPLFVHGILGAKWADVVLPLQLLVIAQLLKAVSSTGSPFFLGTGNPKYSFQMQLARSLVLLAVIYPCTKTFGLVGTAWAVILSAVAMLAVFLINICRISSFTPGDLALRLKPVALSTAVMACMTMLLARYLAGLAQSTLHYAIALAVTAVVGAAVYVGVMSLTARRAKHVTILKDAERLWAQAGISRLISRLRR